MNVILIHGFAATKKSNWFPWLAKALTQGMGASVKAFSLPHAKRPNVNRWIEALGREIGVPDERTIIVAHSLGCVTLLKYIEGLPDTAKVGGMILVSAFDEPLPLLPLLNSFVAEKPHYERILPKAQNIRVMASSNDIIVPIRYTKKVAERLGTPVIEMPKAGHFTTQDGYREFPALYDLIVGMKPEV